MRRGGSHQDLMLRKYWCLELIGDEADNKRKQVRVRNKRERASYRNRHDCVAEVACF